MFTARAITLVAIAVLLCASVGSAEDNGKTKVLLIGKQPDHPYGAHMYLHTCEMLTKCLQKTDGIETVVSDGWPKDKEKLDGLKTIVIYTTPAAELLLDGPHRDEFDRLMKEGVGLVTIHWASTVYKENLERLGGQWIGYTGATWVSNVGLSTDESKLKQLIPDHPVCRGWTEYDLHDEFYLNPTIADAKPLLQVSTKGKDVVVGWVHERDDNGRVFGTTLGHFYRNFQREDFRRMIVNGILWTAHVDVPKDGAPVDLDEKDLALPAKAAGNPKDAPTQSRSSSKPISKILFGSCIKQEQPMPIFDMVLKQKPDLFVFLGDNIYADTNDMKVMRAKYAKLKSDVGFSKLMKNHKVLATWDDHDYGVNDGGAEYAMRNESQQVFVDFWDDPKDSPRRKRAGVYQSRMFGPKGKRVQVIVLDTRYFRGPLKRGEKRVGGPYYPSDDKNVTMLGEEQWKWLEEQLRQPAEIRIVASSIQCVSESSGQETWSNLPHERKRFFDLVTRTKASGVLILSGDRHWSELSVDKEESPYPIYDLTSSSLNEIHKRGTPTANKYRDIETTYHKPNYGEIVIDWEQDDPSIKLQIIDMNGEVVFGKTVELSELQLPN